MPIFIDELTSKTNSIFKTVLALAKRAEEINTGKHPLVKTKTKKSSTVAMKEFKEGKIVFEQDEAAE